MFSYAILSVLAVLPAANCIAFGGPAPTGTSPNKALNGWSPKPTKGPSVAELKKKRQTNLDPETCGWVDGDYSSWLTCGFGSTCMLYSASSAGMAGCCEGSDYQNCGWATSCMDYDQYASSSACDTDCELNTFIRKCTNMFSPYCVTWTYPSDNIQDYGCASTSIPLIETIRQSASDPFYSSYTSMTLSTLSGDAVTGWDQSDGGFGLSSVATDTDFFFGTGTDSFTATDVPVGGGGGRRKSKKGSKVSIGLIVGAVIGGLVLLFIIGAAIIFICVKQKKKRQLAANQQTIAAAQASRPQSQFNPPMQQQPIPMGQPPVPPMPSQSPQPPAGGYFGQPMDQKINPQVGEYPVPSPISNPPTPAPAYVQPYYSAPGQAPPMPAQSPVPYQNRGPTPGTHEVDAISVPQQQPGQQGQGGNVYEIGGK